MNSFCFKFTTSESSAGVKPLYIANHVPYKPRLDLNIYNLRLESTLTEISNSKMSNIIIRIICKHPSMDLNDFDTNYLKNLLDKVSREKICFSAW